MSPSTLDELLEEAEKVSSVIVTARRLMAEGKTVDLSNMETKISVLCANAQATNLQNPAPIRDALSAIMEDLNALGEEMTTEHKKAGGEAMENSLKRAIDAYSPDSGES